MLSSLSRIAVSQRMLPWRAETRALLTLAGPLIATQLAQMAIMTTDVVMLGRLGKDVLAGSALGTSTFFFLFLFGMGPATAVSPMIAHILGADGENTAGVRAVVRMGLWVVGVVSLPMICVLAFARDILIFLGQDPVLAAAAGKFVLPLCFGIPFALGFQVLRNFAVALDKPKIPLVVMVSTIGFNALADYALIFGHFGLPRLGLTGSGIASALSYGFSFACMAGYVTASPSLRRFRLRHHLLRFHADTFTELFKLGIPIGLTMIFEVALFNAAMLLMGTFGTDNLAAHQIALNVSSISYMVPLGLGMAATVRIGYAAGAGDRVGVRRSGYTTLAITVAFMSSCALIIAVFARPIAALYFPAAQPADTRVIDLAAQFLLVAGAFQIFDGVQCTAALALRGMKDARMPMWIAAGSYWLIGFPMCIFLSVGCGLQGLGVWVGLALALFIAALSLSRRFYLLSRR